MKNKADLIKGWLRKAHGDETALQISLDAGILDGACFHAQQAAEKYLKAYLVSQDITFPFTHNLSKLLAVCADIDPSFLSPIPLGEPLTPYGVELRYDLEFRPTVQSVPQAYEGVKRIRAFVLNRIPEQFK